MKRANSILGLSMAVGLLVVSALVALIVAAAARHAVQTDRQPTNSGEALEQIATAEVDEASDADAVELQQSNDPRSAYRVARERKALRREYVRFAATSRLSPADLDRLYELAAKRGLMLEDAFGKFGYGQSLAPEDRQRYYDRRVEGLNAEMRAILGDEWNAFTEATEKIPLRRPLRIFSFMEQRKGRPGLTPNQIEDLTDLYWEFYKAAGVDIFFSPKFSSVSTDGRFTEQIKRRIQANGFAHEAASEFVESAQLSSLAQFQTLQATSLYSQARLQRGRR